MTPPADPDDREPDPRILLANERTFLAWIRTALAFVAGGIAIAHLIDGDGGHSAELLVALGLIVFGAALAGGSYVRWRHVERTLRGGGPLPATRLPGIVAVVITVGAAVAAVVYALAPPEVIR